MQFSKDLLSDSEKIFAVEKMTYIDSRTMPEMHYHSHYEILYVTKNERVLTLGENDYVLNSECVALIPPYIPHLTTSGGRYPEERILISFKGDLLVGAEKLLGKNILYSFDAASPIIMLGEKRDGFCELIDLLLRGECAKIDTARLSLRLAELLYFLSDMRECCGEDSELSEILKFIEQNFTGKITLDMLSEKFYINKYTLLRKFQKHTGMGLPKYLNTIRIINAKRELSKGKRIIDVALSLGFGSVSSFDRAFLSEVGISPREYRKRLLEKEEP